MRELLGIIGILVLGIIVVVLWIIFDGLTDAVMGEPNWLCATLTLVVVVAVVVVRKLRQR